MAETTTSTRHGSGQGNGMAAVAYILTWITGLIVLLTSKKEDQYTRYHAIQAIGLGIAMAAFYIVWNLLFLTVIMGGSSSGPGVLGLLGTLVWVAFLVVIVLCAVKAYQGSKFRLPIVAAIADKNA